MGRNPLKSGQCFLQNIIAIPYRIYEVKKGRNPLKSGHCFLPFKELIKKIQKEWSRNPLKSGHCFLPRSNKGVK